MTYHYDTFVRRFMVFDHGKLVAQFERLAKPIMLMAFPDLKET